MDFLNMLFTTLDLLCDEHAVQKVETAGDAYIAACGVLTPDNEGFSVAGGEHNAARRWVHVCTSSLQQASHLAPQHDANAFVLPGHGGLEVLSS